MQSLGFIRGIYSNSVYYYPQRKLHALVHGDDFVTTGSREQAQWFMLALGRHMTIKTTVVGHRRNEVQETRILNRVIRCTVDGWEMEADQRHGEQLG